ncbi:MAG: NAD(P)-binding domain-containing protein [Bacteroidota bacterium]
MLDRSQTYCIIGAGPAGLCAAVSLKKYGFEFDIIDKGQVVGGIWDIARADSAMYESAHFISSKTLSGFRDFPMPDEYPDYPRHDKILQYIQAYAKKHELEQYIQFETEVQQIQPLEKGALWEVEFADGEKKVYAGVICATGLTWYPNFPQIPGQFTGEMYHSQQYVSMDQFRDKRVLIIGAGNSGCDIACDAAKMAKEAYISLRRGYHFIPKYIFGKPCDVYAEESMKLPSWLDRRLNEFLIGKILVGDLEKYGLQKPDHPILTSHPIMNTRILHHLGHGDIAAKRDVKAFEGKKVCFVDGSELEVDVVVLATGYKRIYPFISDDFLTYKEGVLDLYLEVFDRRYNNLFFLGGIETDGAAYAILGKQADLVASFLASQEKNPAGYQKFVQYKSKAYPNLRGKTSYVNSQRHNHYVKGEVYHRLLDKMLLKQQKQLS